MEDFMGKDIQFVEDWLVRHGLDKLVDVFKAKSTLDEETSMSAIGNVVRNKLPERPLTRKRLTKASADKFTLMNTVYCQQFLNTVSALPPEKLAFFDEAGVYSGLGNPEKCS
ncbi:hypothetical protein ACROYT_G016758 [Oculina patagonica]